jgi:AraC-like DNA-binding protein
MTDALSMDGDIHDLSQNPVPEHALAVAGWAPGGKDGFPDGLRHRKVAPSTIVAVVRRGRYEVTREDGSVSIAREGEAFVAQDGEWLDILHGGQGGMSASWVHLRITVFGSIDACRLWELPPVLQCAQAAIVLQWINATTPVETGLLGAAHRIEAALATLRVLASVGRPSPTGRALLAPAAGLAPLTTWVRLRLGEPISIADLAREAGVSPSRLHARFQQALGCPPLAWVRELRLLAARDRLLATPDAVADIGAACGFADPFHFSRAFRARFGASPSQFRRKAALTS